MESIWETEQAAPYYLFVIPDVENETNTVRALGVPKLLSLLAYHDANAEIKGLKEFPKEERPPVRTTFWSYRAMVFLGLVFIVLSLLAFIYSRKDKLRSRSTFLTIMLYAIPLPYIAGQVGWLVTEIGRQPWIVYGLLKTSDAVTQTVSVAHVAFSLIGFTLLYGLLAVVDVYLLVKVSRKGPDRDTSSILPRSKRRR
jgi:cytochrome d ubiquinol oxidase subunit I